MGGRRNQQQDVLSTLAHEMVHLEQHHFGKPSRAAVWGKGGLRLACIVCEVELEAAD